MSKFFIHRPVFAWVLAIIVILNRIPVVWMRSCAIVIALAVAILIHVFVGQITRVSGESMENTLHNGDFLIVSKWDHIRGISPNYGDIVIIDSRVNRPRT